ncbi:MAG TPA: hypothetical protein VG435_05545 [Acidimicrobiales bacterium]|nr:hypothetical protein [Acidimicrobiales bacterium]
MASDEELRKVAEDIRALARSLARDIRTAADSARENGRPARDALRDGLRDAAEEARREFRRSAHYWAGWDRSRTGRSGTAADPENVGGGPVRPPWAIPQGPDWNRKSRDRHRHHHRGWAPPSVPPGAVATATPERRPSIPPVRRRWDALVLTGILVAVFGVAWVLSVTAAVSVSLEAVLAAGLMLLGACLVVTGRTDWSLSRHAWPVWVGGVLIIGLLATSTSYGVSGALSHLSVGKMTATATTAKTQTLYGGFGQLTVDASQATPGSVITIENVAGQTVIDPPRPNQTFVITGRLLAGDICIDMTAHSAGLGASINQTSIDGRNMDGSPSKSTIPVYINVHQLAGQITIENATCSQQ